MITIGKGYVNSEANKLREACYQMQDAIQRIEYSLNTLQNNGIDLAHVFDKCIGMHKDIKEYSEYIEEVADKIEQYISLIP